MNIYDHDRWKREWWRPLWIIADIMRKGKLRGFDTAGNFLISFSPEKRRVLSYGKVGQGEVRSCHILLISWILFEILFFLPSCLSKTPEANSVQKAKGTFKLQNKLIWSKQSIAVRIFFIGRAIVPSKYLKRPVMPALQC